MVCLGIVRDSMREQNIQLREHGEEEHTPSLSFATHTLVGR